MNKLTFTQAFKYPFNRAKGMWNILWVFVPFIGWFALGGYGARITQEFLKGEFNQLPLFSFKNDLNLGFSLFLKSLPFLLAYMVVGAVLGGIGEAGESMEALTGFVSFILDLFVVPMLAMNFIRKMTIESFFEFDLIKVVINNFKDYVIALLNTLALTLVFLVLSVVLVGIPAGAFTKNIFLADFYRRNVK
jgi:hypothetical protein